MALLSDLKVDDLNFEGIKANFISYLKSQDQFRDYNFDASGMQVLLDVLAYNTYYNSFYLNMVANEAFLSTAQKRNSVVNLARSLGYVPKSKTSATITGTALISVTGTPASITVPAYTSFTGSISGVTYTFNTVESTVVSPISGAYIGNLTLKEGRYINQRITVNLSDVEQRFLIPNTDIDTSTISINVLDSVSSSASRLFTLAENLTEIKGTSQVYFIEEVENGQYEIFFGDDVIGKKLDNGNVVVIEYLISSGAGANDVQNISYAAAVDGITGIAFISSDPAAGGSERESINKIKFSAPKSYEAQNRVVTVDDYKALLLKQSNIASVSVWGGEDNDPPAFGKVYVAAKPSVGETLTASEKNILIETIIKPKKIVTIGTEFVDPEYIYLLIDVLAKYDATITSITAASIKAKIIQTIIDYNDDNINEFSKYFRYSKLSRLIDASDRAILNNILSVRMRKEVDIQLNQSVRYETGFSNPINPSTNGRPSSHPYGVGNQLSSNEFTINGLSGCFLEENNGIIRIYRVSGQDKIAVNNDAGTLNYTTGKIILSSFSPSAFADGGNTLKLTAFSRDPDILPLRNQIIAIRDEDISVTMVDDRTYSLVNR